MKNSEKLRTIRKIMGLRVDAFATILGVSDRTVYRWEGGSREPHSSMCRIAELFLNAEQMQQYFEALKFDRRSEKVLDKE